VKPRLILIVIALVVLPTAILSFLANRALRSREDLLQYRLKMDAASTIQVVSRRLQARFEDDMEHVRAVVSECLARGGKNADIEAAAVRLNNSRGTVNQLFLFMNPWGFIYPEPGKKDEPVNRRTGELENRRAGEAAKEGADLKQGSGDRVLDPLVSALRREIALAGTRTNALSLTVEDASFWFSAVPSRKDLYAGFEINQREFMEELSSALTAASGDVFALVAEGPGIAVTNEVVVSDAFGGRTEIRSRRPDLSGDPVATGRLLKPFDHVIVKAYVVAPDKIKKAAELRYRLDAWGIVLMAAGICVGLFLVLKEAAAEIRNARARSDFVIGVSHDLRTPVASMRMLAESLYLDHVESPDQQKKFLRVIVRESERLSQLIERVLFFVRMNQRSLVYRFAEADIGKLVAVTVEAFKTKAAIMEQKVEMRAHHLSIGTAIEPGLPAVKADESAITQVILNLIDNAVKYSREKAGVADAGADSKRPESGESADRKADGDPRHTSRVPLPESAGGQQPAYRSGVDFALWARAERRGTVSQPMISVEVASADVSFRHRGFLPGRKWVRILVKDRGIGIEKKELRRIFKRFYRVQRTADSNVSGVGLGLALCRHVAEAHGGWIEVESEIGRGSTFSVYLPVLE
jgi:signal transduction histidine kinase